jgi:hypothetical protein
MTDINDSLNQAVGLGVGLAVTGMVLNKFDKFGRPIKRKVRRKRRRK